MEAKKQLILEYEKYMARQLARHVIEKPAPSVWMIFVPIFFVFYVWKVKQYSNGIKSFVENYLLSRRRALDTAFEAVQRGAPPEIEQLVQQASGIPAVALPLYRNWMSLLVDHYRGLLTEPGKSQQDLKKSYYQNKTRYLSFCDQLSQTENSFNTALLPTIEGDQQDLRFVLERIEKGAADLRHQEVEEIFS